MPRQEKNKKVKVTVNREYVDGDTYDVLRIDGDEIVAFHVTNIDKVGLQHTRETMATAIADYLKNDYKEPE